MIDVTLQAALAGFDDAALASLANPGLVRRARRDIEEGKVLLVAADGGRAELEADGQRVVMDGRGPRMADCACKAASLCRHRIAAVILLRELPDKERELSPASDDPQEIVEAIAIKVLERWAGKAAWRGAFDLIDRARTVESSGHAVVVAFDGLDGPVRILRGQGPEGIVSGATKALRKPIHAAAVLAARRHFGLALPDSEPVAEAAAPDALFAIDADFLDRVGSALCECLAFGFNLAPLPVEESVFIQSVSSRVDRLPRLAAMLRAIAAQLRLRRQRSLAFDPDQLLEFLATAYALTKVLARGQIDADRLATLAGSLRRDYISSEPLHLIGCGGERWRTPAGARGVTAWFYEPAQDRFLSVSNARGPGQDPNFTPDEAWKILTHWQCKPLAALAHSRIELTGAGLTSDGRLSSPVAATAKVIDSKTRPQADWDAAISDWSALTGYFRDRVGVGLEASAAPVACLIAPQTCAAPWFDDLAQQLIWPVRDVYGAWLALTLDHDDHGSLAIAALEASVDAGWLGVILTKFERRGDGVAAVPMTLFGQGDAIDLAFGPPQRDGRSHQSRQPPRRRLSWLGSAAPPRFGPVAPDPALSAIVATWRLLIDRAEAGRANGALFQVRLLQQADRLEEIGLSNLATIVRAARSEATVLAAAYALHIARQQRDRLPMLVQG